MEQIMNISDIAAGAGVEALFVTQDTGQVEKAYRNVTILRNP
jgi:type IV secretion system protein VirD4